MPEESTNNQLTPQQLAKHLRQPEGEIGKKVGEEMNKGNRHICLNSYKVLSPKDGDSVLEIGMANGFFVKDLLEMAKNLTYTGIDFSAIMIKEANQINKHLIDSGNARFVEGSVEKLPFDDNYFDCITTTNTLYFWPDPKESAHEISRVLKPSGKLLIAYRNRSCMDQIEATNYGFEKYDVEGVETLLKDAGFKDISTERIKEPKMEFDGKTFQLEGFFTAGVK